MSNSRVESAYPDVKQVNDERWVPPLPDSQKPIVRVRPCLGCLRLPEGHPGTEVCMRAEILRLRNEVRTLLSDDVRKAGTALLQLRREVEESKKTPCSAGGSVEQMRTGKRPASSFAQG
jgi:hypothetical protein